MESNDVSYSLPWRFKDKIRQVLCLVLPELITYLVVYFAINTVYRVLDNSSAEKSEDFTRVVKYLSANTQNMARETTFLLGFYVTTIAKRWWDQVYRLPEPDNLAICLSGVVIRDGFRALKTTIMRYAMTSWILCLLRFNPKLHQRFLNASSFENLGLLSHEEVTKLLHHHPTNLNEDALQLWMRPLNWAANLVKR